MIFLDYNLEPSEMRKLEDIDLTSATPTQLDYYLFCGSVLFRIDGASFDASWRWIPILNFVTQLYDIVANIKDGETRVLEFTESDATIEFRRTGNNVEIMAEYSSAKATASQQELQETVTKFSRRVFGDLISHWPELAQNPFFKERNELVK